MILYLTNRLTVKVIIN